MNKDKKFLAKRLKNAVEHIKYKSLDDALSNLYEAIDYLDTMDKSNADLHSDKKRLEFICESGGSLVQHRAGWSYYNENDELLAKGKTALEAIDSAMNDKK